MTKSKSLTGYQLVWFRKDLRISDHHALSNACHKGPVKALFINLSPQWHQYGHGPKPIAFLMRQVYALKAKLDEQGIELEVLSLNSYTEIPATLSVYCQSNQIQQIHAHRQIEHDENQCDQAIIKLGLPLTLYDSNAYILPPHLVQTQQSKPYKVFTPFFNRWKHQIAQSTPRPITVPKQFTIDPQTKPNLEQPDESHARELLKRFCANNLNSYHKNRDIPSLSGTSGLSPYLANGAISGTQCLAAALKCQPNALTQSDSGAHTWISELAWRDFYRHLILLNSSLAKHYNFKKEADNILWLNNETDFQAWTEGLTGYPIVDAAIRQLLDTGWMHNRLRMVVASFLTKHLLIDWRWGERFFLQHLLDGDLAANNGGWQWAASTGCDAQPYFRIFNPILQSQRFDPDGEFIRRYVPELAHLDNKSLHFPTPEQRKGLYPEPVVEHSFARMRALECFNVLGKKKS